ncbi:MAG: Nre family DNA repair protein [Methanobacteriota archaeon]
MLCGYDPCPLLERVRRVMPSVRITGKEVVGTSPPSVFVGRYGYPKVAVGPLLPPETRADAEVLEDPAGWLGLDMPTVIGLRASLVRTRREVYVRKAIQPTRDLEVAQALAMSEKPVDTDVTLKKKVDLELAATVDGFSPPMGPSVPLVASKLTSNPRVPRKVDALVSDTDASASTAVAELIDGGISGYHIQRLLSVGLLGRGRARKLVPTRWSITATDDIVGKRLLEDVRGHSPIGGVEVRYAERFGNRFHVLLLPREWSFELVETWKAGAFWASETVSASDHEPFEGRTSYAEDTAGGYYATRLAVLEHLAERRRQAAALVVRDITPEYYAPLGVWLVRETMRLGMATEARRFDDVDGALRHLTSQTISKDWDRTSWLLDRLRHQRTLLEYVKS